MARIRISAALRDFERELNSLIRLDNSNQSRHNISQKQLHLLTEGVFLAAFRAYENYVEEVFLLYTLEKKGLSGIKAKSYLKPKNFDHSRELIRSSMTYISWNNPEIVMERAETYLHNGEPLRPAIGGARQVLIDMKTIRNQIAHNSFESRKKYNSMLRRIYGTTPINFESPGEHLLKIITNSTPPVHFLYHYINRLLNIGQAIAN